jgi:hypothetical protein
LYVGQDVGKGVRGKDNEKRLMVWDDCCTVFRMYSTCSTIHLGWLVVWLDLPL